jgi:hypothetical protein
MIERIGDRVSGRAWAVPLSSIAIGAVLLGAYAAGGDWVAGLVWFGLLAGSGALLVFGRRSTRSARPRARAATSAT